MIYYAILAARQNNTVQYTHIHANTSSKKTQKDKTVKWNRTDETLATLLYCAGECAPYSLLYCVPANVNRDKPYRHSIATNLCDTKRDKENNTELSEVNSLFHYGSFRW